MTDTKPLRIERAPETKQPRRRYFVWMGLLLGLALLVAGVVFRDQGVRRIPMGELTWSQASGLPSDDFRAVTTMPDGFLAASPAAGGGVDFWTSPDGVEWSHLGTDRVAFGPDEAVWRLTGGPGGYVADVGSRRPFTGEEIPATVWTSRDGLTWHRSSLEAEVEPHASPYVRTELEVHTPVSGPTGFAALGGLADRLDFEAIRTEFAPTLSAEIAMYWETPEEIGFGTEDGREVTVRWSELGITPAERIRLSQPVATLRMWSSADGETWEAVDISSVERISLEAADVGEGPPQLDIPILIGRSDGFYLFTGSHLGFRSSDGRVWDPFALEGLPADLVYGVTAIDEGFLLFGDTGDEYSVWTSPDGRRWSHVPMGVPTDLGAAMEFAVESVSAGPFGVLAFGETRPAPTYAADAVLIKDGYVIGLNPDRPMTLADEVTGEFIAEIPWDEMQMHSVSGREITVTPGATGWSFTDETGEEFLVITEEERIGAEEAAHAAAGVETEPRYLMAFSQDLVTWIMEETEQVFADPIMGVAVGSDRALALVVDHEEEMEEDAFPPVRVWVAELAG